MTESQQSISPPESPMGLKFKIFKFLSRPAIKILGLHRASKWACRLAEQISPVYRVKNGDDVFLFHCPNNLTRWRAQTMFTKEPDTIQWIDSFQSGEIFFDVGANIGLYSIYAAKRGIHVVAFEPESQNYALLHQNIFLNEVKDQIIGLNIAMSDEDRLDYLYLPTFEAGGALNSFGEPLDWNHQSFPPLFKQAILSCSLDSFVNRFPEFFPSHLKIDVDGLEEKIIRGAEKTLKDSRLKSVLIELNESLPGDLETAQAIESAGLKFTQKRHSSLVQQEEFKNIYNFLFWR